MIKDTLFSRRAKFSTPDDWTVLGWITFMHLGALAGFFTFSWRAFWVCLFLWWLTGGVGICLGYHRYFTHRSYMTSKPVEYFLAICGCMAGEAGWQVWQRQVRCVRGLRRSRSLAPDRQSRSRAGAAASETGSSISESAAATSGTARAWVTLSSSGRSV